MKMTQPMKIGDCLGIIGGGQLSRLLAMAARHFGLNVIIWDPDRAAPAAPVANKHLEAPFDDDEALATFMQASDRATYEFENIPLSVARILEKEHVILPRARALEVSQDRLVEKRYLQSLGFSIAPFWDMSNNTDRTSLQKNWPGPSILKTRRFGYDGKGQQVVNTFDALEEALERFLVKSDRFNGQEARQGKETERFLVKSDRFNGQEARQSKETERLSLSIKNKKALAENDEPIFILEGLVNFTCEISVILTRTAQGVIKTFPVTQNHHEGGILRRSFVPAMIDTSLQDKAVNQAKQIADNLDYVGTLAVEFFVIDNQELLINEFAPRVHNSGHWTLDGDRACQFSQHIRAVCGWPLAEPKLIAPMEMINLIGEDIKAYDRYLNDPRARLHLYGKSVIKTGRKMGHVNRFVD